MDISAALYDARCRAGLTQSELAKRAGTSQAAISAYESGTKAPSVATLTRLLAVSGARLTITNTGVRRPTHAQHALVSRKLLDVLALAEALPTRHAPELRFPPRPGLAARRR